MMRALRKVFIILAAFFCIALVVSITWGIIWLVQVESFPTPAVPTPKLPAQNAFDDYVAAGKLLLREPDIGEANSPAYSWKYTLAQKQALLAPTAPALKMMTPGLSKPYLNPPIRRFDQLIPYLATFRALTRMLELKAVIEEEKGQWQASASTNLDAIRMGEQIPHGSTIIGDLVGIACETIGRRTIWSSIDHLNAADTRADILRLDGIRSDAESVFGAYQEEKWANEAALVEFLNRDKRLKQHVSSQIMVKMGIYNSAHYWDKMMAFARQPYAARAVLPRRPHDPFGEIASPNYGRVIMIKHVENETQDSLLLVALALHAYKLDHGAYPNSLGQLVPTYLKSVPDDPFALNSPLRYRLSGATYVLYSVGPDGIDDGGKAIINHPSHYSERYKKQISDKPNYFVNEDSKGDIVAGVNIY